MELFYSKSFSKNSPQIVYDAFNNTLNEMIEKDDQFK